MRQASARAMRRMSSISGRRSCSPASACSRFRTTGAHARVVLRSGAGTTATSSARISAAALFAMTDPFWMILTLYRLGDGLHRLGQMAAEIEFVAATQRRRFRGIQARRIATSTRSAQRPSGGEKYLRWCETRTSPRANGEIIARVRKQLYVSRKSRTALSFGTRPQCDAAIAYIRSGKAWGRGRAHAAHAMSATAGRMAFSDTMPTSGSPGTRRLVEPIFPDRPIDDPRCRHEQHCVPENPNDAQAATSVAAANRRTRRRRSQAAPKQDRAGSARQRAHDELPGPVAPARTAASSSPPTRPASS